MKQKRNPTTGDIETREMYQRGSNRPKRINPPQEPVKFNPGKLKSNPIQL